MIVVPIIFALFLIAICIAAFSGRLKAFNTDGGFVSIDDIPVLFAALATTGGNGSFWAVQVPHTARTDGDEACLQYSIEDGTVGMDWVLLDHRNVEDKQAFINFATERGARVQDKIMKRFHTSARQVRQTCRNWVRNF